MVAAFERDIEHPLDLVEPRLQRYVGLLAVQGIAYGVAGYYERAYHAHARTYSRSKWSSRLDPKSNKWGQMTRKMARAERGMKRAALVGKVAGKAARGVPIVGQALIVYDVYTLVDWAFAKGKLPAGARDRS